MEGLYRGYGIMEKRMEATIEGLGFCAPKVCKIMALMVVILDLGLLFYILLGLR